MKNRLAEDLLQQERERERRFERNMTGLAVMIVIDLTLIAMVVGLSIAQMLTK